MKPKKNAKTAANVKKEAVEPAVTLKDLLRPEIAAQLKASTDAWKAAEEKQRQDEKERLEQERKAEQKRLEQDFGHLLETSKQDWKKFK